MKKWLLLRLRIVSTVVVVASGISSATADEVTLRLWTTQRENGPDSTFAQEFSALRKDVAIDVFTFRNLDAFHSALETSITDNSGPDIISIDNALLFFFAKMGGLFDITERLERSPSLSLRNYHQNALASVKYGGSIYGIPKDIETLSLFVNNSIFSAAGISEAPKTWDELLEFGKLISEDVPKAKGITFPLSKSEATVFQLLPWLQMVGSNYDQLEQPNAIEAIRLWEMLLLGKMINRTNLYKNTEESFAEFESGKAAMAISSNWVLSELRQNKKFEWSVAALPVPGHGVERSGGLGGGVLAILNSSILKTEAFNFLEYYDLQSQRLWPEFGVLPSRIDVPLSLTGDEKIDSAALQFSRDVQDGRLRGPTPNWPEISEVLQDMLHSVLLGQSEIKGALSEAQLSISKIESRQ